MVIYTGNLAHCLAKLILHIARQNAVLVGVYSLAVLFPRLFSLTYKGVVYALREIAHHCVAEHFPHHCAVIAVCNHVRQRIVYTAQHGHIHQRVIQAAEYFVCAFPCQTAAVQSLIQHNAHIQRHGVRGKL